MRRARRPSARNGTPRARPEWGFAAPARVDRGALRLGRLRPDVGQAVGEQNDPVHKALLGNVLAHLGRALADAGEQGGVAAGADTAARMQQTGISSNSMQTAFPADRVLFLLCRFNPIIGFRVFYGVVCVETFYDRFDRCTIGNFHQKQIWA